MKSIICVSLILINFSNDSFAEETSETPPAELRQVLEVLRTIRSDQKNCSEVQSYAILVADEYRSKEGIALLVKHVAIAPPLAPFQHRGFNSAVATYHNTEGLDELRWLPPAKVLCRIGMPALRTILVKIQEPAGAEFTEEELKIFAAIIYDSLESLSSVYITRSLSEKVLSSSHGSLLIEEIERLSTKYKQDRRVPLRFQFSLRSP